VHRTEFNTSAAVYELYQYTVRYNDDVRILSCHTIFFCFLFCDVL